MKQVKIVYDGTDYWLLWNWQTLIQQSSTLNAAAFCVSGPFVNQPEAEQEAANRYRQGVDDHNVPAINALLGHYPGFWEACPNTSTSELGRIPDAGSQRYKSFTDPSGRPLRLN